MGADEQRYLMRAPTRPDAIGSGPTRQLRVCFYSDVAGGSYFGS
jgi:hypothetical protein